MKTTIAAILCAASTAGLLPAHTLAASHDGMASGASTMMTTGRVTRMAFSRALITALHGGGNERCFQDIAPSRPVRYTKLFRDVPITASYAPELCVGLKAGLLEWKSDGSFGPNEPITVAEASMMLAKSYGFIDPPLEPTTRPLSQDAMHALASRQVLPPTARPQDTLTTNEAVQLFVKTERHERFPLDRLYRNGPRQRRDSESTGEAPQEIREPSSRGARTYNVRPSRRTLERQVLEREAERSRV